MSSISISLPSNLIDVGRHVCSLWKEPCAFTSPSHRLLATGTSVRSWKDPFWPIVLVLLSTRIPSSNTLLISGVSLITPISSEPIAPSIMGGVFLPSVGASITSRSLSGNPVVDFHLMKGEIVPHRYNPGYIILSYLVSFVGCWTALKLLHQRTSHRGYYNWSVHHLYLSLAGH